ncbi:hypothetical protein [Roseimicrobium gellanilyticum]|nr:hypothetical protein [Roseimicrobium gellanilyticum]
MLPAPSEPPSTGASVALGGAALAASAMLAGLALRNKSPLPLAAGLAAAAAASLSLMKKTRDDGAASEDQDQVLTATPPPCPLFGSPSRFQILDESELDEEDEETRDWVDADAVFINEKRLPPVISFPAAMALPSHATSFPLLDDEGNVIVGHQMLPVQLPAVLAESSAEFGFPLGPLIWEPETEGSTRICMEQGENIIWFGSSREAPPPPSQMAQEIVVPMSGVVSLPERTLSISRGIHWTPYPATSAPLQLTLSAAPESVTSILESLRAEAMLRGETAASGLVFDDGASKVPTLGGSRKSHEPLSFADWMLSTQQPQQSSAPLAAPSVSPAAASSAAPSRSPLHAPGRQGEPPKVHPDDEVTSAPAQRPGMTSAAPDPTRQPALVYHRSVAPMAPVDHADKPDGNRPLTLFLALIILTVALVAVAIWGDGYRTRKTSTPPPWTQEAVPAKAQSTASAVPNP